MRNLKTTLFFVALGAIFVLTSCKKDEATAPQVLTLTPNLSDLKIFQGPIKDLSPSAGYHFFEGSTDLFNDSCEKNDLIFIPPGTKITAPAVGSGLPTFPVGTVIVKTFFYYKDLRNHTFASDKTIIETRVMVKNDSKWVGGTYAWSTDQTEGTLIPNGKIVPVGWIDDAGQSHKVSFRIAPYGQCVACHTSNGDFVPIGFQMKNVNVNRIRAPFINQLTYFQNEGVLNPCDPSKFASVAPMSSPYVTQKSRGYLSSNCAHCHSESGMAAATELFLDYELPLSKTGILSNNMEGLRMRDQIITKMSNGSMPKFHSSVVDKHGIAVVKAFLDSIPN